MVGDIFTALENGVDVFDSSCVYSATERGCGVVFPIEPQTQAQQLLEGREEKPSGVHDRVELSLFEIDLNEER